MSSNSHDPSNIGTGTLLRQVYLLTPQTVYIAMKKITLLFVFGCLYGPSILAQEDTTYWRKDFRAGISFNQASFSDNWTGGGVNSVGLNAFLNYKANYARDIHTWDNEIDLAYGVLTNEGQGSRKSLDRVFLDTKYGRELSSKWVFFTSLSLLTQFADGFAYDQVRSNGETYDSLISSLFSPAFVTSSWGFEYHPADFFKVRFGPFSPRLTFVNNDRLSELGAYGVDPGDNLRTEWLAFQLLADFNRDIAENLNLKWKYILFSNYEELELDKIDHRLDLVLAAKVNNFVDVSLGLILIYDFDQIDELQFSQALNMGIVYTFKNFKD